MYIDLWEAKWLTSQLSRDILASVGLNLGKWIWQDRRTQQTPLHAGYLSVVGGCSSHIWGYPCWVLNISYTWYGYNLSMYIIYIYCMYAICFFSKIQHGFLEAISWSFPRGIWGERQTLQDAGILFNTEVANGMEMSFFVALKMGDPLD